MSRAQSSQCYEAILFLRDHSVSKQMRYGEFEAILDGVIGLKDFADSEATLVYVEMDAQLRARAMVFFLLYFDEQGRADEEWNLPLRQLAKSAGPGPDMGAGPTRLCCRSQCPINWHQNAMWDPSMKPGSNEFLAIRRALAQNRLGFRVEIEAEPVPEAAPAVEVPLLGPDSVVAEAGVASAGDLVAEHRVKIARILREQRLRIKTLEGQHQEDLAEVSRQRRIELQTLRNELQDERQRGAQVKVLYEQVKQKLDQRDAQCLALQEQLGEAKRQMAALEAKLRRHERASMDAGQRTSDRMAAEITILKEQLERRNLELSYRDEREQQLRGELESLRETVAHARAEHSVLQRLIELDVVFVVYHPGAGHITIPPRDISRYAENPMAYVADKCGVAEAHYRQWLEHYERPACGHPKGSHGVCGEQLPRVALPADFKVGRDNRCAAHRA